MNRIVCGAGFGVLTIKGNATTYTYEQFDSTGKSLSKFEESIEEHSSEQVVALIIVCCSLAFLCYFIYSWVSCYMKKPRIKDEHENVAVKEQKDSDGMGEGYDMRPIANNEP